MGFLFGKTKDDYMGEYNKAIKDTKQAQADAVYQQRYNQALYDANKDTFEKAGISNPGASYFKDGRKTNALQDTIKTYDDYLKDLNTEKDKVARRNKYNIYGDGLIGGLLNPFHQVGTGVQDLATSGISKWQSGERDLLSDLGAAGEVALQVVPVAGALAKGGKAAATVANSLGKSMLKGAAYGSGYGALGSLKDMGAQDFDAGELTLRTLLGGAIGGGMAGVGYGIGKAGDKLANIAKSNREVVNRIPIQMEDDMGNLVAKNGVSYQDALNKAGLSAKDNQLDYNAISNIMQGKSLPTDITNNHDRIASLTKKVNDFVKALGGKTTTDSKPGLVMYSGDNMQQLYDAISRMNTIPRGVEMTDYITYNGLAKGKWGQALQGVRDLAKNTPDTISKIRSKVGGTKIGSLLNTKTGKVGLGLGSGLLLSKLMNGGSGNTNPEQMTEEELYNYIVNGGQ